MCSSPAPAPMDLTPEQCFAWLYRQRCLANDQAARNAFLRAAPWVQQLVVQRGKITRPAQLVGRIQQIARDNPTCALGPGGQPWSGKGKPGRQRSRSPVQPSTAASSSAGPMAPVPSQSAPRTLPRPRPTRRFRSPVHPPRMRGAAPLAGDDEDEDKDEEEQQEAEPMAEEEVVEAEEVEEDEPADEVPVEEEEEE